MRELHIDGKAIHPVSRRDNFLDLAEHTGNQENCASKVKLGSDGKPNQVQHHADKVGGANYDHTPKTVPE